MHAEFLVTPCHNFVYYIERGKMDKRGFTLIELLVTIVGISVVGLFTAELYKNFSSSSKSLESKIEVNNFMNMVSSAMLNKDACKNTLQTKGTGDSLEKFYSSGSGIIYSQLPFALNMSTSLVSSSVKINSLIAELDFQFKIKDTPALLNRKLQVAVSLDGSNKIADCIAGSAVQTIPSTPSTALTSEEICTQIGMSWVNNQCQFPFQSNTCPSNQYASQFNFVSGQYQATCVALAPVFTPNTVSLSCPGGQDPTSLYLDAEGKLQVICPGTTCTCNPDLASQTCFDKKYNNSCGQAVCEGIKQPEKIWENSAAAILSSSSDVLLNTCDFSGSSGTCAGDGFAFKHRFHFADINCTGNVDNYESDGPNRYYVKDVSQSCTSNQCTWRGASCSSLGANFKDPIFGLLLDDTYVNYPSRLECESAFSSTQTNWQCVRAQDPGTYKPCCQENPNDPADTRCMHESAKPRCSGGGFQLVGFFKGDTSPYNRGSYTQCTIHSQNGYNAWCCR